MRLAFCVVLATVALGCQRRESPAPAASQQQPPSAEAAAPALNAANAVDSMAPGTVTGVVMETMDSGGYTYLKLSTAAGEEWAAVRESRVKAGGNATVVGAMLMQNFESKTLGRTFPRIYFGDLAPGAEAPLVSHGGEPAAADPATAQILAQHANVGKSPAGEAVDVAVPKATGADARTVAEVHGQRAALKDKKVVVRGKVVKANSGIMGRSWIHIRDGSGSATSKDDDLTVTSVETATVGDVVVVRGTVHVDRDFGSGYVYPVIVEDASITK